MAPFSWLLPKFRAKICVGLDGQGFAQVLAASGRAAGLSFPEAMPMPPQAPASPISTLAANREAFLAAHNC
jgi:hypothetical protein